MDLRPRIQGWSVGKLSCSTGLQANPGSTSLCWILAPEQLLVGPTLQHLFATFTLTALTALRAASTSPSTRRAYFGSETMHLALWRENWGQRNGLKDNWRLQIGHPEPNFPTGKSIWPLWPPHSVLKKIIPCQYLNILRFRIKVWISSISKEKEI